MLLVTIARIVNGYRILAAVPYGLLLYDWCLYRDDRPVTHGVFSAELGNVIMVDLCKPLAPGAYELCVTYSGDRETMLPRAITALLFVVARTAPYVTKEATVCLYHSSTWPSPRNFAGSTTSR